MFKMYHNKIMQELFLGPTFGCVVLTFIFHPLYSNLLMEKTSVAFVTCNNSPGSMLVLSLSILKQCIHDNTYNSTNLCIQIPVSFEYWRHFATGKLQPANHKYTCQKTWRA